jgi:hypothetical protein
VLHRSGIGIVVSVQWFGSHAIELTYKDATGRVSNELLYRDREADLEIIEEGRPWSFDGDGALFRLVSEAQRIHLAHLFDPVLAVHPSIVEPLPHQITAVYESMLPRQPLRFLLADNPGAGKTIMAGLLIRSRVRPSRLARSRRPRPNLRREARPQAVASTASERPNRGQAETRRHGGSRRDFWQCVPRACAIAPRRGPLVLGSAQ